MPGKPKNIDLMKLDDIPKLILELTGVTVCRATVYNWTKNGRQNYVGGMTKLKTTRRLGRYYSTKQWVLDFIKEIG